MIRTTIFLFVLFLTIGNTSFCAIQGSSAPTQADRALIDRYNQDALFKGAFEGNIGAIKKYRSVEGASLMACDQQGSTLLHWIARGGQIISLSYLISTMDNQMLLALLKMSNKVDKTPLHIAVERDFFTLANLLLEAQDRLEGGNHCVTIAPTILKVSIARNNIPLLQLLLSYKDNQNMSYESEYYDEYNELICYADAVKNKESVQLLLNIFLGENNNNLSYTAFHEQAYKRFKKLINHAIVMENAKFGQILRNNCREGYYTRLCLEEHGMML